MAETNNAADDNQLNENESGNNEGAAPIVDEDQMSAEDLAVQTENEDFLLNFKDEDWEDKEKADKARELLKNSQTTIHQKRHYREKVKELTTGDPDKDKKPKPAASKEAATVENQNTKQNQGPSDTEVLDFRMDHPEFPKEAIKEIAAHAKAHGIGMEEAFKSPLVQSYVKQLKNSDDNAGASIPSSGRKPGTGGASRDWTGASAADIEKERNRILGIG